MSRPKRLRVYTTFTLRPSEAQTWRDPGRDESTPEAAAETVYAALYREPERLAEVFATCRAVCDELKARHGSTPPLDPDLVRWMLFRAHLSDATAGIFPLPPGDDR